MLSDSLSQPSRPEFFFVVRDAFYQPASGTILREARSGLLRATLRFGNLTFPRGTFL
jgi:hypothetical protein